MNWEEIVNAVAKGFYGLLSQLTFVEHFLFAKCWGCSAKQADRVPLLLELNVQWRMQMLCNHSCKPSLQVVSTKKYYRLLHQVDLGFI